MRESTEKRETDGFSAACKASTERSRMLEKHKKVEYAFYGSDSHTESEVKWDCLYILDAKLIRSSDLISESLLKRR